MTLSHDEQLNGFPGRIAIGVGGKGRERSEIPSPKIREKLPLTSPILHGRKFPSEVEKRGRIRRRRRNDVELPRDGCLNARYGLPYDSSIDKKLFPAATSYIILETETDNEIPPLTVGVRDAINHDKKREDRFSS